ncbi:GTPase ObgE [Synechococcus elongatus]|uniref:GTPase Obg n=1 Tax=Synechococcus elongatus PCC 11801 TaxID=2219813 RepID=A0AAN1UUZ3_SYNEL|nr:GTPase ObgE [Synechococcus elongatus]AZB73086.1 GTPase ObgE [Synechococcus elongatus PCC 11801]
MQFIDHATICVKAGDGGDGIVAFRREKYVPAGGPSGGNGGRGGSVILVATEQLQTLLDFRYLRLFKAQDGERGGPKGMTGASADDLIIQVPCGTAVYDAETDECLGDLTSAGQILKVAQGGKGGLGNQHFLSNSNRAPEHALPGLPGEERQLRLELKLLAEVGLIGLPNAGKSTLISVLSAAKPKIADYPFTTLVPNLGVVRRETGDGTVFADIPGLIEGAHRGAGLGHDFLRHIERTRLLIHLVDLTAEDPIADWRTIQAELKAYGRGLSDRPQILALNKIDAVLDEDLSFWQAEFQALTTVPLLCISSADRRGLEALLRLVWQWLDELDAAAELSETRVLN